MNVKILCAVLSVIMLAGSCTSTQEPEGERVFTRSDFKETRYEVPQGALLYLRNHTEGQDERIFEMVEGRQKFW